VHTSTPSNVSSDQISASHPLLLIHEAARIAPNELGIVIQAKSYSYFEASVAIFSMADFLRAQGITRGDLVAIDLPMEFDLIAKHALFLLGATSCSLFGFLKVPEGLDANWLVTFPDKHPVSEKTLVLEPSSVDLRAKLGVKDFDLSFVEPDRPALLVYTSGTTGSNKAVVITDSQLAGRVLSYRRAVGRKTVIACLVYNSGVGLFTQLEQLSRLKPMVFTSTTPSGIVAALKQVQVSGIVASPAQLVSLIEIPGVAAHLSQLEQWMITGSVVSTYHLEQLLTAAPNSKILILFGANETGAIALTFRDASSGPGFVGHALPEAEIEVVDEAGDLLPAGELGVVRAKTEYMASYYHNDMMESARSFRDGWFYSGDLGYLDPEGNLHLAGRTSDVINAGGVKINPNDVEQKVMTLDGISACAGVEVAGPSGVNVFGLAVVGAGEIDLVRLEKLVKSYFPFGHPTVYKQFQELPRNQNGKTDKAALKKMFEQLS